MTNINGVGKDAPTVENERGGKQAHTPYAFHLMDAKALLALAKVMEEGAAKYTRDNWRKISREDHLNHAVIHIMAYWAGDRQDDHLEHAFTRLMMALATKEETRNDAVPYALTDAEVASLRDARDFLQATEIHWRGTSTSVEAAKHGKAIRDLLLARNE